MDLKVGDLTPYGSRVCSIVRSNGEVIQIGVRGNIDHDGMAPHWSVDPITLRGITKIKYHKVDTSK